MRRQTFNTTLIRFNIVLSGPEFQRDLPFIDKCVSKFRSLGIIVEYVHISTYIHACLCFALLKVNFNRRRSTMDRFVSLFHLNPGKNIHEMLNTSDEFSLRYVFIRVWGVFWRGTSILGRGKYQRDAETINWRENVEKQKGQKREAGGPHGSGIYSRMYVCNSPTT